MRKSYRLGSKNKRQAVVKWVNVTAWREKTEEGR